MAGLDERYRSILGRIRIACEAVGRDPSEITLVVVTKNHPVTLVEELFDLGARDFGENKDQEAAPKAEALALSRGGSDERGYRWHFVGQLQSNKAKSVVRYANAIHSLDRESLLEALAKAVLARREQEPEFELGVFVQLNLTEDPNRGGIHPSGLLDFADRVSAAPGLRLLGVMAVGSLEETPEHDFALVRQASRQLQGRYPSAKFVSAGMSEDFETAISFGATHLRIGTAITGKRQ